MGATDKAKITAAAKEDFTKVTFRPDLDKFKMKELESDITSFMMRRAYDIAGCSRGVKVFLNDTRLPVCCVCIIIFFVSGDWFQSLRRRICQGSC